MCQGSPTQHMPRNRHCPELRHTAIQKRLASLGPLPEFPEKQAKNLKIKNSKQRVEGLTVSWQKVVYDASLPGVT